MATRQLLPESQPEQKSKRQKLWGCDKDDLVTVYITCNDGNKNSVNRRFTSVQFQPYHESIIGPVYIGCSLKERFDDQIANEDVISKKLFPLKKEINPLGEMRQTLPGDKSIWNISKNDFVRNGLCNALMRAFLSNMDDPSGKVAITLLLNDIINKLGLSEKLSAVSTGSTSHFSFCATSVKLTGTRYSTSSVSDKQSPPKQMVEISTPLARLSVEPSVITRQAGRSSQTTLNLSTGNTQSTSSTSSDDCSKAKICAPDILVYYIPDKMISPIKTSIAVSIKKRDTSDEQDLVKQLLSRLPYQTGLIFGLSVNAVGAVLYSVQCHSGVVDICSYNNYAFRKPQKRFCVVTFWNFIVDIGLLLSR